MNLSCHVTLTVEAALNAANRRARTMLFLWGVGTRRQETTRLLRLLHSDIKWLGRLRPSYHFRLLQAERETERGKKGVKKEKKKRKKER